MITQDRLKKFNEIRGTVAGNAYDEIHAAEFDAKQEADLNDRDEQDNEELKD